MKPQKYKNLHELIPHLPTHSYVEDGKLAEPITLIILGNRRLIRKVFKKAGWYLAVPISLKTLFESGLAAAFNRSYRTGPMRSLFVSGKKHKLGFERPTRSDTYRRRHHLRLWDTEFMLYKKPVWVGMLSYDRSFGLAKGSLSPTHHISAALNSEENFLADNLDIKTPQYVHLSKPEEGIISIGDPYVWDGEALLINLADKK